MGTSCIHFHFLSFYNVRVWQNLNRLFIVYCVKLNKDGTEFRTKVGLVVSKRKRCYIYIVIAIKRGLSIA